MMIRFFGLGRCVMYGNTIWSHVAHSLTSLYLSTVQQPVGYSFVSFEISNAIRANRECYVSHHFHFVSLNFLLHIIVRFYEYVYQWMYITSSFLLIRTHFRFVPFISFIVMFKIHKWHVINGTEDTYTRNKESEPKLFCDINKLKYWTFLFGLK